VAGRYPPWLLPAFARNAIDRARARRFLALVGPPTEQFVATYGLDVRAGPFAGMHYIPGLERQSGDLIAKLIGAYECELHAALEELTALPCAAVIDVGCAEGYYAVGFARLMAGTTVYAYDIDAAARSRCAELARLNAVEDRVVVGAECAPEQLAEFSTDEVALFCDCEGYEVTLLDPDRAPLLRGWWILVELHDFVDPSISATIRQRFSATHEFELIRGVPRDGSRYAELADIDPRARAALLSEYRPSAMSWGVLRPSRSNS
jgi:hypothetical protein